MEERMKKLLVLLILMCILTSPLFSMTKTSAAVSGYTVRDIPAGYIYWVFIDTEILDLVYKVDEAIKYGWVPVGGVSSHSSNYWFMQAVQKL